MARMARVVVEGVPHHITQRGNNRQDVFLRDEDRRFYLKTLSERCRQHGVRLLGYCLMTNHVHLAALPAAAKSLALGIGQTHWRYAQQFNRRYGRSGHLWQNRFYSCPLGPSHLVSALAYVDLNPVRAGLVGAPLQYPWSSTATHVEGRDPQQIIDLTSWKNLGIQGDWGELLASEAVSGRDGELRAATSTGVPFADAGFVRELETRLGRRLEPRPPGPVPKAKRASAAS